MFSVCRVSQLLLTVDVQFVPQRCRTRGQTWSTTWGHPTSSYRSHRFWALAGCRRSAGNNTIINVDTYSRAGWKQETKINILSFLVSSVPTLTPFFITFFLCYFLDSRTFSSFNLTHSLSIVTLKPVKMSTQELYVGFSDILMKSESKCTHVSLGFRHANDFIVHLNGRALIIYKDNKILFTPFYL